MSAEHGHGGGGEQFASTQRMTEAAKNYTDTVWQAITLVGLMLMAFGISFTAESSHGHGGH